MGFSYKHTLYASYIGYITQAVINNLAPLLFVTFQREFSFSLEQIGLIVTVNFGVQIFVDFVSARYVDRIGYRIPVVAAHIFSVLGLACMGTLPYLLPDAYAGLMIAIVINACGGGLIEVLISPIVESLPGDEKASAMSLLHSFYCWGHVGVVLLSTLYFNIAGMDRWFYLPFLWAIVPFINIFLFAKVPIRTLTEKGESVPLRRLFTAKVFWVSFVLFICAGASEQAMSQWSSLFAETGLGISKTAGDLLGPCAFAVLMGLSRTFFGIKGSKIDLKKALILSSILCIASYGLTVFSPSPLLSLAGCAITGLSVGLMWPGGFSLAAQSYPQGGTAMFALLALAGDLGCSLGPGVVGFISDATAQASGAEFLSWISGSSMTEIGLKTGILTAIVFPAVLLLCVILIGKTDGMRKAAEK